MTSPLANLKIVEFAGLGPVPLAGQLLADLGADVIVVDRTTTILADHSDVNRRGKRSIALNLKATAGHSIALQLVKASDILIEGFRPGVMERLGLGPLNCPDTLIYGRMTGWGQTGPMAHSAGHDITYLAMTGVLSMLGPENTPPVPPLNLVADYGGGSMFLLLGLLSAVIERGVSGKGQVVDAAMIDGVPAMMGLIHSMIANGHWVLNRGENWLDGGAPFYRCYECADGGYVAVGALEPKFYAVFLDNLDLLQAELPDQNDRAAWPDLHRRFEAIFKTRDRDNWAQIFLGTDACVAPVLSLQEAAKQSHLSMRGVYVAPGGVQQAAPAPRFGRSTVRKPSVPTGLGEDTEFILSELGFDATARAQLRSEGATL